MPGKHPLPLRIGLCRPVMDAAIDLHGQRSLSAVEIEDEAVERALPQELPPSQPAIPQCLPQALFR